MTQTSNLLYQRYRSIVLVVYTAVLCAGLVDRGYGGIGPRALIRAPENARFLLFTATVLALICLELKGVGRASFMTTNRVKSRPFAIRLLLFLVACAATDLNYSKILFLPILLYSYLAVGKRLSYIVALLGVAVLFGLGITQVELMRPPPPSSSSPPPLSSSQIPLSGELSRRGPPTGATLGGGLVDRSMGSLIALLFTLLLARALSQATQAQQKLTNLLASLEASHIQLKQYSNRIAELAATEERNHLARDIHDSLGHHLAAINIQLAKANAYRHRDPARAYEAINHAQMTVKDALKDVRVSVSSLRQAGETFCLQKSLAELVARMHHSELRVTLKQTGNSAPYSRLKLMTLYRVVQEGLTNVHKHAQASQVEIALYFGPQVAQLRLADDGTGFDVRLWRKTAKNTARHGLAGLQERVNLVGGTFTITSGDKGTILTADIPHTISIESTHLVEKG